MNATVSIAPMMSCTDRHFRYFFRGLSQKAVLYTEMISANALIRQNPDRFLAFDPKERPLVAQFGGHDCEALAFSAKQAENYGYDGLNLNLGCPSHCASKGQFGASLMLEPELAYQAVQTMRDASHLPVSVKIRTGVNDSDSYAFLADWVGELVHQTQITEIIVHARKAILGKLSPRQNRQIPPLDYEKVYRLKQDFKDLKIIINGGFKDVLTIQQALHKTDGVMVGRAAYADPYYFSNIDSVFYQQPISHKTRWQILQAFQPYVQQQLKQKVPLNRMTKHLISFCKGLPGAKHWRQQLSTAFAYSSFARLLERMQNSLDCTT